MKSNFTVCYPYSHISVLPVGSIFRFDPRPEGSNICKNKSVVAQNSLTLNLLFAFFFDMVYSRMPGAFNFVLPYGKLSVRNIVDEKIPGTDEFVLSASTVAFMETCILRSLFPCNDKANDEWLQSTADFTKQRIRFHSEMKTHNFAMKCLVSWIIGLTNFQS